MIFIFKNNSKNPLKNFDSLLEVDCILLCYVSLMSLSLSIFRCPFNPILYFTCRRFPCMFEPRFFL